MSNSNYEARNYGFRIFVIPRQALLKLVTFCTELDEVDVAQSTVRKLCYLKESDHSVYGLLKYL